MEFWMSLFSFRGRSGRLRFLAGGLLCAALYGVLLLGGLILAHGQIGLAIGLVLGGGLLVGWPFLALVVRRLHDLGLPGLCAAALAVPVWLSNGAAAQWPLLEPLPWAVRALILLWLALAPGQPGDNAFGPAR